MQNQVQNQLCPNCQKRVLKTWNELTFDEKLIAERMPLSARFYSDERKRHLFCPNCWFEETEARVTPV